MGILCAFVNLRKTTIGFAMYECPSVRLSPRDISASKRQNFLKSHIELLFENLLTKFNFNINMIRISGTLHEDVCTIVIMSCSVLLVINVSDKVYSENRNTHFIFSTFKENRVVMG